MEKLEVENLKMLLHGVTLNVHQRKLAQEEYNRMITRINKLEKQVTLCLPSVSLRESSFTLGSM